MTGIKHSFTMTVDKANSDDSIEGILFVYQEEFTGLFQDCVFTHNIKISHIEENMYLIEYPENDTNYMYHYLCDDRKIKLTEMCDILDALFANPGDDWWEIIGLRGNIISS
jgi:hypothetical protein